MPLCGDTTEREKLLPKHTLSGTKFLKGWQEAKITNGLIKAGLVIVIHKLNRLTTLTVNYTNIKSRKEWIYTNRFMAIKNKPQCSRKLIF
jgi:hypothetical protein